MVNASATAALKTALYENFGMPGYETTWYSQIEDVFVDSEGAHVTMHSGGESDTFICRVVLSLAQDYEVDEVSVIGDGLAPEICWL